MPAFPTSSEDPRAYVSYRTEMLGAAAQVDQAIIALTATRRMDPSKPFWAFRAVSFMGMASGLLGATQAQTSASYFQAGIGEILAPIEAARALVVNDQQRIADGGAAQPTAYADARAKLIEAQTTLGYLTVQLPEFVPTNG
jgi:hypothetical protein